MSTLFTIWMISVLVILAIISFAYLLARRERQFARISPHHIRDLVGDEIVSLHRDFSALVEKVKPHGKRTVSMGLSVIKKGQDVFISRVFGGIQTEKGRASSFYLKQIAENKEKDVERENSDRGL